MKKIILPFFAIILLGSNSSLLTSCSSDIKEPEKDSIPKSLQERIGEHEFNKRDTTPQVNPYKDAKIEVIVVDNKKSGDKNLSGYGYEIHINDALYIRQPHIPGVAGNAGFSTQEKAKRCGELVAYKIRNNIMPPSVDLNELDSIKVLGK
jgi:hypothetical protein